MKIFMVDVAKCSGCYNCQIACKDEHCENDWAIYAAPQPHSGQFWCKMNQKEHGQIPKVRVEYWPIFGGQNPAIADYAPEVLMDREDGLQVIMPEKAKGRRDIAEKFAGVYFNEELDIPQACTGCAHLVDEGSCLIVSIYVQRGPCVLAKEKSSQTKLKKLKLCALTERESLVCTI